MTGGFRQWLGGRGPLMVVILVLLGLWLSNVGASWRGADAASPAANCAKATGTALGKAHFTPQPKKGAVTPLPHATPVPSFPGLKLGMITRPMHVVTTIQTQANKGNKKYTWYRDPRQVIRRTLPQEGFKPPIDLVSAVKPVRSYSGRPVRKGEVKYKNTLFQVYVAQPGTRGRKGIWVIVTILRQHLVTGMITRPAHVIATEQKLVNSGKAKYAFYTDPNKVVMKELPLYGFTPPFKIIRSAKPVPSASGRPLDFVLVSWQGGTWQIQVAQPGTRGKKGVWAVVGILPA